jgi:hypothetical protein
VIVSPRGKATGNSDAGGSMSGVVLPDRRLVVEPELDDLPGVPEMYVDGALVQFRDEIVRIRGYVEHGSGPPLTCDHVVTLHMRRSGFDQSLLSAYWRWIDAGPGRDFAKWMAKN